MIKSSIHKMTFFIVLLIKLSFLSTAYNHVLTYDSENSLNYNSNLSNFLFTLLNAKTPEPSVKSYQVDCFGMGKTFATTLEWFLMNNTNGSQELDVKFLLSSRKQPQHAQVITGKQFGLEWTDFQVERRTVVIVHGFLSHGKQSWIINLEKSFLEWGDVNIVVVDWSSSGNTWNYYKAAVNTKMVGHQIARFLEHIENATSTWSDANSWGSLYLVGHSLGAHICGFTAKELKRRQSKWKVERITGLDPAQPCFKTADPTMKLHKSDAPFVDIIHTNGRLLSEMGLGLPEPIGHVDFYPNGGKSQPGCTKVDSSYFEYLPIPLQEINKSICSHGRSYVYLTESLVSVVKHNCTFWAHHWDLSYRGLKRITTESCNKKVCSEMGINAINYPQRGTFFVATSNSMPFCINNTRIIAKVVNQVANDYVNELDD